MPRIFNFSAGPAVLPEAVLEDCKANLLDYAGCGMSVMELSHRGPEFMDIIARAEADLRALLSIPDAYDVLFLQGGASGQFAALPLNLTAPGDTVDYVVTGSWSKKVRAQRGGEKEGRQPLGARARAREGAHCFSFLAPRSLSHTHSPSLPLSLSPSLTV